MSPGQYVYPRLDSTRARLLLEEYRERTPEWLRDAASASDPRAAPLAVGGKPVPVTIIEDVARQLRKLADDAGFPSPLTQARTFDAPAGRALYEQMDIIVPDAAAQGVWSFMTLVVLPDLAVWRFPTRTDVRLLGRPRNTLRRLWWRSHIVGDDLIDAPGGLGEDELVAIMERPTLAADHRLARVMAQEIVAAGLRSEVPRSPLMRDLAKRIMRVQAVRCLSVLTAEQLVTVVAEQTRQAVGALATEM